MLKSPLEHIVGSDDESKAVHVIGELPKVDSFIWSNYLRLLLFEESFEVEVDVDGIITLDEFFVLVFGRSPELFILSNSEEFTHFGQVMLCEIAAEFSFFCIALCLWH